MVMRDEGARSVLRMAVLGAVIVNLVWCGKASAGVRLLWHKTRPAGIYITSIALSPSGKRIAVRGARPLESTAEERRSESVVLMLSSTGAILWEYTAPAGETLGGMAITPDGQRLFCDYHTKPRLFKAYPYPGRFETPPDERDIMPLDTVSYWGGIYCFGPTGKVLWKTRRKGVEVGGATSSPLGRVEQATRDRLLVVKHGWECIDGLAVLDFRGQVLFRQDFEQVETALGAVLFPDGRSLALGWWDKFSIINLGGRTIAEIKGLRFQYGEAPVSPDGKYVLLQDTLPPGRLAIADRSGRLKWTYTVPSDWSDVIVPSSGYHAGERVVVCSPLLFGQGLQGKSVLLVRGNRRVLFRFSGSSWVPKQVELPANDRIHEPAYLSPDGTVVVIFRSQVELYDDSGTLLRQLDLPASPRSNEEKIFIGGPGRRIAFSNPARYVVIGDGPDLWFIEVTATATKGQ